MPLLYTNLFLIVIYAIFFYSLKIKKENKENMFLFVCLLQLCLLRVAVNPESAPDLSGQFGYIDEFDNIKKMDWRNFCMYLSEVRYEPLYLITVRICSFISYDYRVFLFVVGVISLCPVLYVIRKYSSNAYLSVIVYVLLFNTMGIYILRQSVAIGIIMLSYKSLIDRNIRTYLSLSLVASFFHYSSVVWIPMYFIYNYIDSNKKIYFICIMVFFIANIFLDSIELMFYNLEYYSMYFEEKSSQKMGFIHLAIILFFIISLKNKIFYDGIYRLAFISLLAATLGLLFFNYMERIYQFFKIVDLFAIPITYYSFKDNLKRKIYLFFAVSLCFALFYFDDLNSTINLKFLE